MKQASRKTMQRKLWLMGVVKIPMMAFVKPRLISIDNEKVIVKIKLRRRTKNHLNSMYFAALTVGADVTAGLHAFYFAEQKKLKISFAFKSVKAEFVKQARTDVVFKTNDGNLIQGTFKKALEKNSRVNEWIKVEALNTLDELVAVFEMQISVKPQAV